MIFIYYVDNLLIFAKNSYDLNKLDSNLAEKFGVKDLVTPKYCLGIQIAWPEKSIAELNQENLLKSLLADTKITECKAMKSPIAPDVLRR